MFSIFKTLLVLILVSSCADLVHAQSRMSLEDAVAEFNEKAKMDRIGISQEPLTVDEVLAAIRVARGDLARYTLPDEAKAEYKKIETDLMIEELDSIESINSWGSPEIDGEFFRFDVWWIDFRLVRHGIKDRFGRTPSHFNVRIRENMISSTKLTEKEAAKRRKQIEENERHMALQRAKRAREREEENRRNKID